MLLVIFLDSQGVVRPLGKQCKNDLVRNFAGSSINYFYQVIAMPSAYKKTTNKKQKPVYIRRLLSYM